MKTIFNLFETLISLMNRLIYIVIGIALVGFLWGVLMILFKGANETARTEGRKFMLYGVLTLFVMTSMWSIVYLVKNYIVVNPQQTIQNNPSGDNSFTNFEDLNRY